MPVTVDDPLFGMWIDREDMIDVAAYIRTIRAGRFNADDPRSGAGDATRTKPSNAE